MNLAKLGDGCAIQHGASRASGMVVISRLHIVVEGPMAERSEQRLEVALQVKERERTRRRSRSQSAHDIVHVAGSADRDALHLQRFRARRFKYISSLEQANIVAAAIQVDRKSTRLN